MIATPGGAARRGVPRGLLDSVCAPAVFLPLLLALAALVSAWYADSRLPTADEGGLLTAAAKILRGGVFYRDLDAYPFPGSYHLLAAAMWLCGEHLGVARGLAAALYCGWVAALYRAALHLLDRRRAAVFGLCLLSFKFLAWPAFSAYLHSDLAFCAACTAIALLVGHRFEGPSAATLLAGACVGLALASKQNLGIYLGAASVAALLAPGPLFRIPAGDASRRWGEVGAFALGAAVALVPGLVWFGARGLLDEMIESGLLRPFTGYAPTSAVSFSEPLAWWKLGELTGNAAAPYFVFDYWFMLMKEQLPGRGAYPAYWLAGEVFSRLVYASIPVAFAWALGQRVRGIRSGDDPTRRSRLLLLAFLSFAVVLSAFPRADAHHVLSVQPLVCLVLFALPSHRTSRVRWRRFEASAVACLLAVCAALALHHRSHLTHRIALDKAEVDVLPADAWVEPVVRFATRAVPEGGRLFVYGNEAQFYFLTGRFYPWPFFQLYPGQVGGEGGEGLAEMLRRLPPDLLLRGTLSWPGVPALADYAPALHRQIADTFEPDPEFFATHPAPTGSEPHPWIFAVMRPRRPAEPRE